MTTITAAIDSAIAEQEAKLEQLRALRDQAAKIEAPGAGETEPSLGGTPPAPEVDDSKPPERQREASKPPPSDSGGSRPGQDNAAMGKARREQIMAYMRDGHPEVAVPEVAALLDISISSSYGHLRRLEDAGEVSVLGTGRKGDPKRYRLPGVEAPAARPKLAPRSSSSTSAARDARKAANVSQGEANRAKVYAAIDAAGAAGLTPGEIAERTGLSKRIVKSATDSGLHSGRVLVDERETETPGDGRQRYRRADLGLAPADDDGARTQSERDVVAAVRAVGPAAADGPGGIHEWLRENRGERPVPMVRSVRMVADGLVNRGVLVRHQGRYELASVGIRRAAA